jgi:hypothetical protein
MTLDEMRAELDHWTFMPGWRFELIVDHPARMGDIQLFFHPHAVLRIHSRVPNTYPPHDLIATTATYPVPVEPIERGLISFATFLREVVHDRLVHEGDEWLKRDGVMVFDPHRRGQ